MRQLGTTAVQSAARPKASHRDAAHHKPRGVTADVTTAAQRDEIWTTPDNAAERPQVDGSVRFVRIFRESAAVLTITAKPPSAVQIRAAPPKSDLRASPSDSLHAHSRALASIEIRTRQVAAPFAWRASLRSSRFAPSPCPRLIPSG